jgi:hypothetical protein
MTAQISDTVHYRSRPRSIAGINGSGLFDPAQQGIREIAAISTACWRGYHCVYVVADDALFLTEVYLGLTGKDRESALLGEGPRVFGAVPRRYLQHGHRQNLHTGEVSTSWEASDFKVDGIREPMAFTGGLLLGDRFIREMYVHMGFHPSYKFRVVHELIFDAGRLVAEHDRSARMAEFREML